jgi:hypothetical protein
VTCLRVCQTSSAKKPGREKQMIVRQFGQPFPGGRSGVDFLKVPSQYHIRCFHNCSSAGHLVVGVSSSGLNAIDSLAVFEGGNINREVWAEPRPGPSTRSHGIYTLCLIWRKHRILRLRREQGPNGDNSAYSCNNNNRKPRFCLASYFMLASPCRPLEHVGLPLSPSYINIQYSPYQEPTQPLLSTDRERKAGHPLILS